jgi:AbiV family abortive infection protein
VNPHTKPLTFQDLRDAGIKSLENATELVKEAKVLFAHNHWSRVVFLCSIAGEELGKCFISLTAVVNLMTGRFNEKRYRERFRVHREKTGVLNFFEEFFVSSATFVDVGKIESDTEKLEKLKLASLYCDFYPSQPYAPSEIITRELASGAIALAENRVRRFAQEIRPKFDQVLEIDPQQFLKLEDELSRSVAPSAKSKQSD